MIEKYPLLDIGFDYSRYCRKLLFVGYKETELDDGTITNRASSNGIISALYSLAVPLRLIFFIDLFRHVLLQARLVAIVMLASLSTEVLFFSLFVLLFVYSGFLLRPQSLPLEQLRQFRLSRT